VAAATVVAPEQVHVLSVQDVVLRRNDRRVLLSSLCVIVTFTVTVADPTAAETVGSWVDAIADLPEPLNLASSPIMVPRSTADYHFDAVLAKTVNSKKVLVDNGKNAAEAMSIKTSGAATIKNFAFDLEGGPSSSDTAINGLVLTNLLTPISGGVSITMRGVKYFIRPESEPLQPGYSDNHYRCVRVRHQPTTRRRSCGRGLNLSGSTGASGYA
jgi:hypothetical protein